MSLEIYPGRNMKNYDSSLSAVSPGMMIHATARNLERSSVLVESFWLFRTDVLHDMTQSIQTLVWRNRTRILFIRTKS